jgi:hypothetical protein
MKLHLPLPGSFFCFVLALPTFLHAQPAAQPPAGETIKLTVHASAIAQPALRYALLPDLADQQRGNAAALYMIASKIPPTAKELWTKADDYNAMPLEKLPQQEVEQFLGQFAETLDNVQMAARRQDVHWDSGLRERGISAPLPYLNDIRNFNRLLVLKARLQLSRHEWAPAARTIQDIFSVARQLGNEPVLIQGLVESSMMESVLRRCIEGWLADGNSPNLYWSLSSLPTPFIDLHALAQWERAEVAFTDAQLRLALKDQLPPQEWRQAIETMARLGQLADASEGEGKGGEKGFVPSADKLIQDALAPARRYLESSGLPKDQVEKMSPEQAVGTYFVHQYRQLEDELWKGWELPVYQTAKGTAHADEELAAALKQQPLNPLLKLLPRARRARYVFARTERHIAMLRTIEAIRDFAAHHEGRPPKALSEITDLPMPMDPISGKAFEYSSDGQTTSLAAPAAADAPRMMEWKYELQFVK